MWIYDLLVQQNMKPIYMYNCINNVYANSTYNLYNRFMNQDFGM